MLPPLTSTGIGAPMRRVEDARLLRGAGRFVDNIPAPGAAHLFVLRSPYAADASVPSGPIRHGRCRAYCWF